MKKTYISSVAVLVLAVAFVAMPSVGAQAEHTNPDERRARAEELREKAQEARRTAEARVEAKKEEIAQKLEGKRLQACEHREAKINSILQKSAQQGDKHLSVFQKIEDRVRSFYEEKQLTVDNYEALVAEADSKEAAAVAAIGAVKGTAYECSGESTGKELGGLLKTTMKQQHAALRDYRTAIKDLIVGVRQGAAEAEETETEGDMAQ